MLTKTSILLVEDNDDDAALIVRVLSRFQRIEFTVERATTLRMAVGRLDERRFDAVLVDLGLPDSDGLPSFSSIHTHANGAAVIVLTGDDREELGLRAVELGAQEYIVKAERAWQSLPISIAYACERSRRQEEVDELTHALANAVDAIATLDASGACVSVNPAFKSVLGYAPEEVVRTSLLDLSLIHI